MQEGMTDSGKEEKTRVFIYIVVAKEIYGGGVDQNLIWG